VSRARVTDFTDQEALERVEQGAALGDRRAASLLRTMLEERRQTGRLHLFSRLAARSLLGDIHDRGRPDV
jgi:hypothetical protein